MISSVVCACCRSEREHSHLSSITYPTMSCTRCERFVNVTPGDDRMQLILIVMDPSAHRHFTHDAFLVRQQFNDYELVFVACRDSLDWYLFLSCPIFHSNQSAEETLK